MPELLLPSSLAIQVTSHDRCQMQLVGMMKRSNEYERTKRVVRPTHCGVAVAVRNTIPGLIPCVLIPHSQSDSVLLIFTFL